MPGPLPCNFCRLPSLPCYSPPAAACIPFAYRCILHLRPQLCIHASQISWRSIFPGPHTYTVQHPNTPLNTSIRPSPSIYRRLFVIDIILILSCSGSHSRSGWLVWLYGLPPHAFIDHRFVSFALPALVRVVKLYMISSFFPCLLLFASFLFSMLEALSILYDSFHT
jgi:hypothetical protein